MSARKLEGQVAIVTGGAAGLGAAITRRLSEDGALVVVLDIDPGDEDKSFITRRVDISNRDQVERVIDEVGRELGRIDIVVNNAGVGAQGDVTANDDAEWARVLSINVTGPARVTAAALPWLRRSLSASVCNIASVVATTGVPDRVLYSASKGAVLSMTRAMAADHLHEGIRVNAVCPGTASTPWVQRLLDSSGNADAALEALVARQPHGRLVTAEEVAEAVSYLTGPNSASTTGTFIEVDGGMATIRPKRR